MTFPWAVLLTLTFTHVTSAPTSPSTLTSGLMLTPLLDTGQVRQAQEQSQVNNSQVYNGTSHAGYLTVDRLLGNHIFFWFFPSMEKPDAPVLLWLNGGPGVPTMQGDGESGPGGCQNCPQSGVVWHQVPSWTNL